MGVLLHISIPARRKIRKNKERKINPKQGWTLGGDLGILGGCALEEYY